MNVYIVPYNLGSESAKILAQNLGARLSSGHKRFIKDKSFIINWGNSDADLIFNAAARRSNILLNSPSCVEIAANKISSFKAFNNAGVPTVEWTTDRAKAQQWVDENGYVYARRYSRSSQGKGIEVVMMEDTLPYVELYTKAVPKAYEYRVHVFKGKVIDFTKKRKRNDIEVNPYIKNASNGWVFCRDGEMLPDVVKQASIKACEALGLHFCALDVLYRERENKVYILEANTAPGLEGTTLTKYIEAFKGEIRWMTSQLFR